MLTCQTAKALFGIGVIVNQKTATIYPMSNPVTQFTENKLDQMVTIPTYNDGFEDFKYNFQYGVFNNKLTPKTYWIK